MVANFLLLFPLPSDQHLAAFNHVFLETLRAMISFSPSMKDPCILCSVVGIRQQKRPSPYPVLISPDLLPWLQLSPVIGQLFLGDSKQCLSH